MSQPSRENQLWRECRHERCLETEHPTLMADVAWMSILFHEGGKALTEAHREQLRAMEAAAELTGAKGRGEGGIILPDAGTLGSAGARKTPQGVMVGWSGGTFRLRIVQSVNERPSAQEYLQYDVITSSAELEQLKR